MHISEPNINVDQYCYTLILGYSWRSLLSSIAATHLNPFAYNSLWLQEIQPEPAVSVGVCTLTSFTYLCFLVWKLSLSTW